MVKLILDMSDYTAVKIKHSDRVFFLKGTYADGHLLAFYSDSPCGCCHDQERGYILISPEHELVDEVNVYSWGSTGEGREVLKTWRAEHGKMKYFLNHKGEHRWKISDC